MQSFAKEKLLMANSTKPPESQGICENLDSGDEQRVREFMTKITYAFSVANPDILELLSHEGADERDRKNSFDFNQSLMNGGDKVYAWSARPYSEPKWSIMRTVQHHPPPSIWVDVTLNNGKRNYPYCFALALDSTNELRSCYYIERVRSRESKRKPAKSRTRVDETLTLLKAELKSAITAHYTKLTSEVLDIYGYGIFTDDSVSSLGPVANRESALTVGPLDKMYNCYRYLAVEWSDWEAFGLFDRVNGIVNNLYDDTTLGFAEMRTAILRVCLATLSELETDGLFGPRTDSRFVVICISDSDDDIMMESAKMLNTPAAFQAYSSEF